jgi:hypothetical protein
MDEAKQEKEKEGDPNVILNKRQVPCIEVRHKIAVKRENKGCQEGPPRRYGQVSDEKVHEEASQNTMQYRRISVSQFGRDEIIEKTQWIEYGRLNVGNGRRARQHVGIPKGETPLGPQVVKEKPFPGPELENKVRAKKLSSRENNLPKAHQDRQEKNRNSNEI